MFVLGSITIIFYFVFHCAVFDDVHSEEVSEIVGFYVGNSHSCVSVFRDGKAYILEHSRIPTYVAFTENGSLLVGQKAKNQLLIDDRNVVYDIPSLIDRTIDDVYIQNNLQSWPFNISSAGTHDLVIDLSNAKTGATTPVECLALIFRRLKAIAELELGHSVHDITVMRNDRTPWYSRDQHVVRAASRVDLHVVETGSAAFLALSSVRPFATDGGDAVYLLMHMGSRTMSMYALVVDVDGLIEVVGEIVEIAIGGRDFDENVLGYLIESNNGGNNLDLGYLANIELRGAVEQAKIKLSFEYEAVVEVRGINEEIVISQMLDRKKFESLNSKLFDQIDRTIDDVILLTADALEVDVDQVSNRVDTVYLCGHATKMPAVRRIFETRWTKSVVYIDDAFPIGLAHLANSRMERIKNYDYDLEVTCNLGCYPLGYGIETANGMVEFLIPYPINAEWHGIRKMNFTTAHDHQISVDLKIYEGARPLVEDDHLIFNKSVEIAPMLHSGLQMIEIGFEIDIEGVFRIHVVVDLVVVGVFKIGVENQLSDRDQMDQIIIEAKRFNKVDNLTMVALYKIH